MEGSGRGAVYAGYHQFNVIDPAQELPEWDGRARNGVCEALDGGGAVVLTGVAYGEVPFTWATYDRAPALDVDGWEDVGEVVVNAPTGVLQVVGWAGMSLDEVNLAVAGPGAYILRVSCTGRDLDYDQAPQVVRERAHLELWPAGSDPGGGTHKVSSRISRDMTTLP